MALYDRLKLRNEFNVNNNVEYGVYINAKEMAALIDMMKQPEAIATLNGEAINIASEMLQGLSDEQALCAFDDKVMSAEKTLAVLDKTIDLLQDLIMFPCSAYIAIIESLKTKVCSMDTEQSESDLDGLEDMVRACKELQEAAEKKLLGLE